MDFFQGRIAEMEFFFGRVEKIRGEGKPESEKMQMRWIRCEQLSS